MKVGWNGVPPLPLFPPSRTMLTPSIPFRVFKYNSSTRISRENAHERLSEVDESEARQILLSRATHAKSPLGRAHVKMRALVFYDAQSTNFQQLHISLELLRVPSITNARRNYFLLRHTPTTGSDSSQASRHSRMFQEQFKSHRLSFLQGVSLRSQKKSLTRNVIIAVAVVFVCCCYCWLCLLFFSSFKARMPA